MNDDDRNAHLEARKRYYPNCWWNGTDRDIAYWQTKEFCGKGILMVTDERYDAALHAVIGRHIQMIEFLDPRALLDEIEGKRPAKTFDEVLAMIPPEKLVICNTDTGEVNGTPGMN